LVSACNGERAPYVVDAGPRDGTDQRAAVGIVHFERARRGHALAGDAHRFFEEVTGIHGTSSNRRSGGSARARADEILATHAVERRGDEPRFLVGGNAVAREAGADAEVLEKSFERRGSVRERAVEDP